MLAYKSKYLVILLVIGMLAGSCTQGRTALEQETIDRMYRVSQWLNDFMLARSYYPETIDEVFAWKNESPPDNPYTGQPMVDTGTTEFDPDTSPGNFHYIVMKRSGQNLGYQIHIFGKDGLIVIVNQSTDWYELRDLDR